jgi:hypothetical protein
MSFLQVQGKDILKENGEKIYLRGVSFGGWLNMENFITGYPGAESSVRKAIREELGEERYNVFFDSLLDSFITEADFRFLSEIGATVVRVPFNYRHFEDDMNPGEYKNDIFKYLDKTVELGRKYGIYIILDLHAAQGWQNEGWHSDNPKNISLMWDNKDYQERVAKLWQHIALRYKDEAFIAGYDLVNEPDAPTVEKINNFYKKIVKAIRAVDKKHIIFLEGNNYSKEFEGFAEPFDDNSAYSSHNYTPATHRARRYPGPVVEMERAAGSVYADKKWLEDSLLERNGWIFEHQRPSWVGEFGALFDGDVNNPTPADGERLKALKDQLEIFNKHDQHWTIWTYKDVGVQGLVVPKKDSEYLKRIVGLKQIKRELGLDAWTARNNGLLHAETSKILKVVANSVAKNLNEFSLDYSGEWFKKLGRGSICTTISTMLSSIYAAQFIDMSKKEIRNMHQQAFEFKNLEKRDYLIEVLEEALKQ